jgi:hypothetical protein
MPHDPAVGTYPGYHLRMGSEYSEENKDTQAKQYCLPPVVLVHFSKY